MFFNYFLLLLFLLTSCSGGSSSSGNITSNNSLFPNFSQDILTCDSSCEVADFKTSEYYTSFNYIDNGVVKQTQNFLDLIKAADSYSYLVQQGKNWAGDAVDVAVVDTGIVMNHNDLDGNYSPDSNQNSLLDNDGHGTHVAGIIAAEKNNNGMHGVAPNANLLSYAYRDLDLNYGENNYDDFVKNSGAKIANLSWGSTIEYSSETTNNINLYRNEINNMVTNNEDLVIVVSSGNDSFSDPVYPAFLATDNIANGQMIVVGAYDYSINDIASFSNKCGITNSYCLLAPGVGIYSTYKDGSYAIMEGTSMAAPMVSGAAAILKSAWPNLNGSQIVDILLDTATQMGGGSASNSTYGHGLLNIEEAVKNQGVSTTSLSKTSYLYDESELYIPLQYKKFFTSDEFTNFINKGVFFDSFGRDYKADYAKKIKFSNIGNLVNNYNNRIYNNKYQYDAFKFSNKGLDINLIKQENLLAKYIFQKPAEVEIESKFDNLTYNFAIDKLDFNLSLGQIVKPNLVADNMVQKFNILTQNNLNHYFDANNSFNGFNLNTTLKNNDKFTVKMGFTVKEDDFNKNNLTGFSSEFSKLANNLSLALKYQFFLENNSMQGISGNHAFNIGKNAKTNILEFTSKYKLKKINYFVKFGLMKTLNDNKDDSFIRMANIFYADNFALGAIKEFNDKSHFGFMLSKPWQIKQGDLTYHIPTGIDDSNNIITDSYKINFDNKLELDYEIFFQKEINDNNLLKFNFILHETEFYNKKSREGEFFLFYDYFF